MDRVSFQLSQGPSTPPHGRFRFTSDGECGVTRYRRFGVESCGSQGRQVDGAATVVATMATTSACHAPNDHMGGCKLVDGASDAGLVADLLLLWRTINLPAPDCTLPTPKHL